MALLLHYLDIWDWRVTADCLRPELKVKNDGGQLAPVQKQCVNFRARLNVITSQQWQLRSGIDRLLLKGP